MKEYCLTYDEWDNDDMSIDFFLCTMEDGKYIVKDFGVFYFEGGVQHRLDGPAAEWNDGRIQYVVDGQLLSPEEFPMAVEKYNVKKYLEFNNLNIVK